MAYVFPGFVGIVIDISITEEVSQNNIINITRGLFLIYKSIASRKYMNLPKMEMVKKITGCSRDLQ